MLLRKLKIEAWRDQNRKCFYCEKSIAKKYVTADHVIPKSKGGKTIRSNILAACQKCNRAKGDLAAEEFILSMFAAK
jgi:5-methylcytosine-specific restriction endonuclease McrA